MTINFPRNLKIDIDNVPDDFEDMIQKNFAEYTEGTSSEFTYQDKLSYIDHIVDKLHKSGDEWDAVKDLLWEKFEYQLDECGSLPDRDDFESIEFMQECYRKGREDGRLYCQFRDERGLVDHHVYEKIMKLECRAIRAVMDWDEKYEV